MESVTKKLLAVLNYEYDQIVPSMWEWFDDDPMVVNVWFPEKASSDELKVKWVFGRRMLSECIIEGKTPDVTHDVAIAAGMSRRDRVHIALKSEEGISVVSYRKSYLVDFLVRTYDVMSDAQETSFVMQKLNDDLCSYMNG